jgi:hypothetical protein
VFSGALRNREWHTWDHFQGIAKEGVSARI